MTSNAITEPGTAVAHKNKMSGKVRVMAVVAIAAGLGLATYGWHWWSDGRFMENTDDAYVGGDITVISAKVPGYITSAAVSDNQVVHAGDLLVQLDDRDYRAALAKADGAVAAQQALLANLDATRNLQQAVIAQARAGVTATAAETSRSKDDELRYQNLAAKSAVSIQSSQRADADFKQAQANGQKAQAVQAAAERELDVIASRRRAGAGRRRARPGQAQPGLHGVARAHRRHHRQPPRPQRLLRGGRLAPAVHRAGARPVGRRQLQGKPAGAIASRPARHRRRRRHARPPLPRPRGQPGAGYRRAVQRAAAGKRHRQLHQDRPARAGAHRARRRRRHAGHLAARPVGDGRSR